MYREPNEINEIILVLFDNQAPVHRFIIISATVAVRHAGETAAAVVFFSEK
jgi:hypothetical protein